jgi:hypothetical protein
LTYTHTYEILNIKTGGNNMKNRERSIGILKEAVANKTLGCYNKKVENCRYFHGDTGTCCPVGAIIPHNVLFKNVNEDFNVTYVFSENNSDVIF